MRCGARLALLLSLLSASTMRGESALSDPAVSVIAGSCAGVASTLACHPLDTLRTRMQTSKAGAYSGTADCLRTTLRTEGWRALYRGLSGPLAAQAVYKSVIFTTNDAMHALLKGVSKRSTLTPGETALSGLVSGAVNAFVVTPVELVRNNLMADTRGRFKGAASVVGYTLANDGAAGLWRGLGATVLRDGLGMALYFLSFHECKKRLGGAFPGLTPFAEALLAGSMAGTGYWLVALPLDPLKSLLQNAGQPGNEAARRTALGELRLLLRDKGFLGLFSGWPVAFGRGIPGAAITLTVYDSVSRFMRAA